MIDFEPFIKSYYQYNILFRLLVGSNEQGLLVIRLSMLDRNNHPKDSPYLCAASNFGLFRVNCVAL